MSLEIFEQWVCTQKIDWKEGSEIFKRSIDKKFQTVDGKRISGGRESVVLDNLVIVGDKTVAIEIEASIARPKNI